MSLVGSLEDLSLGDILQIIHLSRKSGVLWIRSSPGEGRIVFGDGLIQAAFTKSGPSDLHELVGRAGDVDKHALEAAAQDARTRALPLADVLQERELLAAEALDALRREHVGNAVIEMFSWTSGEFSFEIRERSDGEGEELFVDPGMNPQFLALEGTRLRDEGGRHEEEVDDDDDDLPAAAMVGAVPEADADLPAEFTGADADLPAEFTGAEAEGPVELTGAGEGETGAAAEAELVGIAEETAEVVAEPAEAEGVETGVLEAASLDAVVAEPAAPELVADEDSAGVLEASPLDEGDLLDASQLAMVEDEAPIAPAPSVGSEGSAASARREAPASAASARREAPAPAVPRGPAPPVVVIDPDLSLLEWAKRALKDDFPRVHIFQRSEQGISRIRQYLARAESPLVLLSADAPADPVSGARDAQEIVARLRLQAPRMPLFMLRRADECEGAAAAGSADGTLPKPTPTQLADPRRAADLSQLAAALVRELGERRRAPSGSAAPRPSLSADTLARLRELSARLKDPASFGDVLSLVMRFAAETFGRVAMFMVRDDEAVGMAQLGLPKAGGPDDAGMAEVALPHREPAWFRAVLEQRTAVRAAPSDEGDQRLAVLLGNSIPHEAYVAPIESGERIVALLYGDNLPGDRPIGDTAALEVVLHEAGMAIDRAVLERALEEAEQA